VTLALCEISGSKFFLMDEILAHIEQDIKERVIEVIKKYAHNRIVVMISHDNISGEYENEIDMSREPS
jgi:ABC-type Mn2+/Zn2+ transport system ATPase subunit